MIKYDIGDQVVFRHDPSLDVYGVIKRRYYNEPQPRLTINGI